MKKASSSIVGITALLGAVLALLVYASYCLRIEKKYRIRFMAYYYMTAQWLRSKIEGKDIMEYFRKHGFNSVAIYGLGILGELYLAELKKNTDIRVTYFIDKNPDDVYNYIDETAVISVGDLRSQTDIPDVIVVTPVYDFNAIYGVLSKTGTAAKIVSLEDVI